MKTALVTGAGGWLGLELTIRLLKDNYNVKAVDRILNTSLLDLKKKYPNQLQLIEHELDEISVWGKELDNIDQLYHLAAQVHFKPKTKKDSEKFYYINRDCTKLLFDKAIEYNVKKVVFVSTVAVYGNNNSTVNINTVRQPTTPYGISKNEAENYGMKLIKEKEFPLVIVQPVTVYGGNDRGNFRKLYDLSKRRIGIQFGDGKNIKSIIYYKDLITILKSIGEDNKTNFQTIICGTEHLEYSEIIKKFCKINHVPFIVKIPKYITVIIIRLSKIGGKKINNLGENIQSLLNSNIYDINQSLSYIDKDKITNFTNWNCEEEYE